MLQHPPCLLGSTLSLFRALGHRCEFVERLRERLLGDLRDGFTGDSADLAAEQNVGVGGIGLEARQQFGGDLLFLQTRGEHRLQDVMALPPDLRVDAPSAVFKMTGRVDLDAR